ncbi:MAG: hypothetical protein WC693_06005 [Patescibacteria group bacterium]|jgi:hypothetical protein
MDIEDILNHREGDKDKEPDVTVPPTPEPPVASAAEIEEAAQQSAIDTDQRLNEVRSQIAGGKPVTPERIDMQYAGDVMRHFSEFRDTLSENIESDVVNAGRMRSMSSTLERLANPRMAKRVTLADAAPALSNILGRMGSSENSASYPAHEFNNPEAEQKEAENLRGMFSSSMDKLFPDRKPFRPEAWGIHFNTVRRLIADTPFDFAVLLPNEEELYRTNREETAKKIERARGMIVDYLKRKAWFDEELDVDSEISDETKEQMAKGVQAVDILLKMEDYFKEKLPIDSRRNESAKDNKSTEKEKTFEPIIPRGWTVLKHGTNLIRWGEINPFSSDTIDLTRSLSAVSQEQYDWEIGPNGEYDTTSSYSGMAPRPKGISDAEFNERNKPFEIRVLFFQDHSRTRVDKEYGSKLDDETMKKIEKVYFNNMQGGRHPVLPRGERLFKVGQIEENGRQVFYMVPESVVGAYEKESGVKVSRGGAEQLEQVTPISDLGNDSGKVNVVPTAISDQSAETEPVSISGEQAELGKEGIFGPLYQQQTVEQVVASVTPEMKQTMLHEILYQIDLGIRGAEQFSANNPGKLVNRQNMAHFCGVGVSFGDYRAVYQKIYLAATGELKDPTEIASMPVTEYLSKCFGYDLASDSKRAQKLKKYTNALGLPGGV